MDVFDSIIDWFYDVLQSLGLFRKSGNLVLVGLDNAGKTTLMGVLKHNHMKAYPPTLHPTKEELVIENIKFSCFDLGGHADGRKLWEKYCPNASAIVFIVDTADRERVSEAKEELNALLLNEVIKTIPFLILGNKIDVTRAMSEEELRVQLGLPINSTTGKDANPKELKKTGIRPMEVFMCSILHRQGYGQGFKWLSQYI